MCFPTIAVRPTQRPRLLLGAGFILLFPIFLDHALRLSGSRLQSIWWLRCRRSPCQAARRQRPSRAETGPLRDGVLVEIGLNSNTKPQSFAGKQSATTP